MLQNQVHHAMWVPLSFLLPVTVRLFTDHAYFMSPNEQCSGNTVWMYRTEYSQSLTHKNLMLRGRLGRHRDHQSHRGRHPHDHHGILHACLSTWHASEYYNTCEQRQIRMHKDRKSLITADIMHMARMLLIQLHLKLLGTFSASMTVVRSRKSIWPIKKQIMSVGMVICQEWGAMTCTWFSWCHCHPIISTSAKSRMVYPSGTGSPT